jgi:hypothetical protein
MTREEALAMYHPIRASVRRILSAAFRVCNQADLMRAAKQLGLWADGKIVLARRRRSRRDACAMRGPNRSLHARKLARRRLSAADVEILHRPKFTGIRIAPGALS